MNTQWLSKLSQNIRQDPKKAAVLGVLILVMGVMWLRVLGKGDVTPQAAAANAATVAHTTPIQPLVPSHTQENIERLQQWTRGPIQPVERNLFEVDLAFYRREGGRVERQTETLGFWEELAKSRARQTDQEKARRILIENMQRQAASLRLQSTMMGATPKAMVNGKLVQEGNVVSVGAGEDRIDFRVVGIEARRMIVQRDGILLALEMK